MIELSLKRGKERSIDRQHRWVFSGAFQSDVSRTAEGELIRLASHDGRILGSGFFQTGRISLKLLTFGEEVFDEDVLYRRIEQANEYRKGIGLPQSGTNSYRLVNGEGDGLPGLVIDVYGDTAVILCYNYGLHRMLPAMVRSLDRIHEGGLGRIYDKSSGVLNSLSNYTVENSWLKGGGEDCLVVENELRFWVNVESGQKTGFFLDQRENRQYLSTLASGKTVLNTFAYTGGFSIYALSGGAERVDSVEISSDALALCDKNILQNRLDSEKHRSIKSDVFEYLGKTEEAYDLIVLDPPAFAKSIHKRHNAVIAYKRLNAMAMKRIRPGGIILTFSCSQVVNTKLFADTIRAAGIEAGREVRIMHTLGQPADHPVDLFHPETRYLKGLALYVS